MKKIMLATLLLITSHIAFSQNDFIKKGISDIDTTDSCHKITVFTVIEIPPTYQGGDKKLVQDINKKLSLDTSINGTIHLEFTINCKGKAYDFTVTKGIDKATNQILINIVSELQTWKSAVQGGRNVECWNSVVLHIKKGKAVLLKRK
jgi:hypothetical protein